MASLQTKLTNEDGIAREAFTRLARAADEFEGYAHPHAERIAALCGELAKLFGLGRADRASLHLAALAHDLGELAMKRDYIRRAAPLTFEERLDLARHPVIGEQEAARAGADRGAQLLVRWHQEWWNGAGYPDALSRELIPLAARLLRVADAYAALTDARPFRPAFTEEEARRHLSEWAGLEFDPNVVRAFLTLQNLPALRSFARRDEDAAATATHDAATQADEPRADAPAVDAPALNAQGWNIGGHIPEAGTNPYVQRAEPNAESRTPAPEQRFDTDQKTDSLRDYDSLRKAD
jgi:HD-GYP domain-containing protein (c-di-GMP phosphodiesterase class II)